MPLKHDVQQIVADMNDAVDAVIVEGPRDKAALQRAGFEKQIYTCSETDGLVGFANRLPDDETLVILTDFDAAGKQLHKRLQKHILGRQLDPVWRRKLADVLTEHGRRDIESLNNLFDQ